jgi:hypothetical protein
MDNDLEQGIVAAKSGDSVRAFELLTRASQVPATSEQAWLWLSSVVNDDSERLFCLDNVLRTNINNAVAKRASEMLRQKGIFPAVPIYPKSQRADSVQASASKNIPAPASSQANFASPAQTQMTSAPIKESTPSQQNNYETDGKKQELSGFFQYSVMELARNIPQQAVEKLLVGRGASAEIAKTIVNDAQYVVRKARREKYKKRMTRGLLWTVAGLVITCGTYAFASELGGRFAIFYGAIIFGFIDFMVGLFGWLSNG